MDFSTPFPLQIIPFFQTVWTFRSHTLFINHLQIVLSITSYFLVLNFCLLAPNWPDSYHIVLNNILSLFVIIQYVKAWDTFQRCFFCLSHSLVLEAQDTYYSLTVETIFLPVDEAIEDKQIRENSHFKKLVKQLLNFVNNLWKHSI